jgi:endonuclease YncB( thermonuclease family)
MGQCCSVTIDASDPYELANIDNTPTYTLNGTKVVVKVLRVVDGDTLDIAWNGINATMYKCRVRLFGIDAPESKPRLNVSNRAQEMEAAKAAKNALQARLQASSMRVLLHFRGSDKYGRWLATAYDVNTDDDLCHWMIQKGLACAYDGGKKAAFVPHATTTGASTA